MPNELRTMKWWGWGDEDTRFDISHRPDLWPYIERNLNLAGEPRCAPPVEFDAIQLPEQRSDLAFVDSLARQLGPCRIADSRKERLTHAFGKSLRDLWRMRHGMVSYAPDCVLYPQSDEEVAAIVAAAVRYGVRLIPFGGGSNIAGCLEPTQRDARMVVSVDMRRMDHLLALDAHSGTALFEAGVLGPALEEQLNRHGFTLGHFPDSFLFSTLGGWVATRSAGMQSDRYGKIEDIVLALKMVTPSGAIETRAVPKASNGIDVNHLCIGSEGTLGIITRVLLNIHRLPARKENRSFLFADFASGIEALRQCHLEGCTPAIARLNDPNKTALSFAYKNAQSHMKRRFSRLVKSYLTTVRRMNLEHCCLLLAGFEGSDESCERDCRRAEAIYSKLGGVSIGSEPCRAFHAGKYDFPYLRDFLLDRGILCDVSETAAVWSRILPLYEASTQSIQAALDAESTGGWVGCHVSHTYHAGASLYFTFGFVPKEGDALVRYLRVKRAAEDAFVNNGATLSHHHAVGYEHLPWLEKEISPAGLMAIQALKKGLDPAGLMNPGKLRAGFGFAEWGLPEEAAPRRAESNSQYREVGRS
jgi:alkyldihydroxyacetonephosphate synthase